MTDYDLRDLDPDDAAAIQALLRPLPPETMARALTKLRLLTKARDGEDTKMLIAAYMERLSEYPADVVAYVLRTAADTNKFFPAWAELREDLDFWSHDRFKLGESLTRYLAARP